MPLIRRLVIFSLNALLSYCCFGQFSEMEQNFYNMGHLFFKMNPMIKLKDLEELSVDESEADAFYLRSLPNELTAKEIYELNRARNDKASFFMWKLGLIRSEYPMVRMLMEEVERQLLCPIFYLKEYYHRPRPFQVRVALPLLMKKPSYGSYPSGISLDAYVDAYILKDLFSEELAPELLEIANDISKRIVKAGLNFPSDCAYSKQLAPSIKDALLNNAKIKQLYLLAKEEIKKKNPQIAVKKVAEQKPAEEVQVEVDEMSLKEFAEKLQHLTKKTIRVFTDKEVKITAKFPLSEWQLRLDEIAKDKNLEIKKTKTEILIAEKICTKK